MSEFQAGQLLSVLQQLHSEQFTGVVSVQVTGDVALSRRSRVLAFWQGMLTFVGKELPEPEALAQLIKQKLNVAYIDGALKISASRVKDKTSVRELLEFISRFGIFKWEDLEAVLRHSAMLELEQLLPRQGTLSTATDIPFDLNYSDDQHGFSWDYLRQTLAQRQRSWSILSPSGISLNAVPLRSARNVSAIPEPVRRHLDQYVDDRRSLGDIATQLDKDPLALAKHYLECVQKGWLTFEGAPAAAASASPLPSAPQKIEKPLTASKELPIILSVDDSPIVQTMIKRAISDRYQVLLANSAVNALNLLNSHTIGLLLLDVTMPDIDGLELCRTIRSISKFRDLPVIMLTAKDGLMDKVKGQFAGSTHYLTKPVDREKLLPVIEKYLPSKAVA